jgi:hypothetical protein
MNVETRPTYIYRSIIRDNSTIYTKPNTENNEVKV